MGIVTDTYSAKANLSRLLAEVEAGGEVTITRRGKPIAKLVSVQERRGVVFGLLAGQVSEADLAWDKHADPEWQAMLDAMENKPLG